MMQTYSAQENIAIWFQANKLSLNESKTKFTLFHKSWDKDNLSQVFNPKNKQF